MRGLSWLAVVALGCVLGCAEEDKTAPPPPLIDPVEPLTADEQVVITGTAEFGATIEITGALSIDPAEVTADPYTAAFRVTVTLEPNAVNELGFVARDRSNNASEPTIVTIEQEVGHGVPATLDVDLFVNGDTQPLADPIQIAAGDDLRAETRLTDAAGHVIDLPVALSTSIPGAFVAGADIANIRVAGEWLVAATVAGSSFATSRVVTVMPGPATEISLGVSPPNVMAGTVVHVSAVAHDAFGNELPGSDITLASEPALDATYTPACSTMQLNQGFIDATRFVAYDLSGVAGNGYVFTLTASVNGISASMPVTVRPGPAARFAPLDPADCSAGDSFVFTDSSWTNVIAEPVAVSAGESIYYRYTVIDAYGNETTGPVSVVTTAPGANVIDDGVTGRGQVAHLITSGTFDLAAYLSGVTAPATKSFSVDVGPAAAASIFVSASLVSPGDEVIAFATVRDAYGNVVACPVGNIDPTVIDILAEPFVGVTGSAVNCADGRYQRTFTFGDNGTYRVQVMYTQGSTVSASAYVTVLGIDATPPSVSIENLTVNGVLCTLTGNPPICNVSRGDTVAFDLVADDNVALSELQYSAFFETTNTLRTRNLLLSSNATLPATAHFSFNVSNNGLPEDVALVGMAIDGAGNRATTNELLLRVGVYATFGRTVSVVAVGGAINQPRDIAFNTNGDMFIANDGSQNLLQIASGTGSPVVFSGFNRASRYMAVDDSGNIYVSDAGRITRINAAGSSVVNYLSLAGNSTEGLDLIPASVAKGTINAASATDGAIVTVGNTDYELDLNGNGCGGGVVCVVASNTTSSKHMALASAIQANGSNVGATVDVTANRVAIAATTPGESGNAIILTGSGGMSVSGGGTLSQGHASELMVGQTNDNNIYRMPLNLTPTTNVGSNHGAFNVQTTQRGIAVKDMSRSTTAALRDLYLYFIDDNNTNTLMGYHAVDNGGPTQVFSITGGGGQGFQSLYDVVAEPTLPTPSSNPINGCLIVSDDQNGEIYAVDTRDPTSTTPTVTLVARGFNDPRGLTFYNGDLYVADRGDDAIIKLSPTADTSDCF